MASEWVTVPSFGGGLALNQHPIAIRDDEWSWSEGWLAKDGYAEILGGYTQIKPANWTGLGVAPIGLGQNPFDDVDEAVLFVGSQSGNTNARLYKVDATGNHTQITWDAVGTQPTSDNLCAAHIAFLDGFAVMNLGIGSSAVGMIRWNGGATFAGIAGAPQAYFLQSVAAHLVAAWNALTEAGKRSIFIGASNTTGTWTPATTNDADAAVLDDAASGITAFSALANGAAILTRGAAYLLQPTGGIPPFTRALYRLRGCLEGGTGLYGPIGQTPYGTIFHAGDDFYQLESGQSVGRKIAAYYQARDGVSGDAPMPFIQWHDTRGVAIVPLPPPISGRPDYLMLDPATGAWSRKLLPDALSVHVPVRHATIWDEQLGPARHRHWVAMGDEQLIMENPTTPTGGEFVDTKDFVAETTGQRSYVDRIKVDWEPLTNATTDALEIQAAAHNDLSRSIVGSPGLETQGLTFTSVGTLTAGASELPARLKSKFVRWRFKQSSGRARVRGFAFRRQRASDRTT